MIFASERLSADRLHHELDVGSDPWKIRGCYANGALLIRSVGGSCRSSLNELAPGWEVGPVRRVGAPSTVAVPKRWLIRAYQQPVTKAEIGQFCMRSDSALHGLLEPQELVCS